ncbi:MAG: preprotein translocase subunit SecY [Candidatus Pacebacteria bacterium]|nr:preprotein translocase subunit SecY [Candidatus Paceibacterota bacterium]MBP9772673.1 preprotein translocase subunit SecY [Candidatus Paceibacterota bacterium]QQR76281.1 MAG: preprotein translocase subunit SecY [Candidatus Nomurabacteria bacterium]
MTKFWQKIHKIFTDKQLRKRILFTVLMLAAFRILAAIPVPGIDTSRLASLLANNQFLGIINIFSGGGLSNLSIIMLGVGPYITASIIMQLLTLMIPRLKEMYQEEGEIGRKRFTQYSRLLTVPLAAIQGFSLLVILARQGVLPALGLFDLITSIVVIIAGSMLLMWIGELITEFGIGNGVSVIIFAGIVATVPTQMSQILFSFDPSQVPFYILFILAGILMIIGVIYVTEAERPIPVTYAKQSRGNATTQGASTYIPLRVNQAGVIPIIFALSILLFPQLIGNYLATSTSLFLLKVSDFMLLFAQGTLWYGIAYFVLVFLFTYFYTAVTFDPHAMATNLQKGGAFVPGIRPGTATEEYVGNIVTRITFLGALFLGLVAVFPFIIQKVTGITQLAIGGTALLIVVSVVLDIIKKIDAQLSMREY